VRALYVVGADANNKVFREAEKRLLELDPEGSWVTERPHHGAQVLNTLADIGAGVSHRNRWSDVLRAAIDRKELGTSVRAQVAHALMRSGSVPADQLSDSLERLADYLTRATLSNATFLDQAHALQGLAVAKTHDTSSSRTSTRSSSISEGTGPGTTIRFSLRGRCSRSTRPQPSPAS
jgi:hypothetical protein